MKKYNVGLVGAGGVTELHLEGYKDYQDRVQVTSICDLNSEILQQRADKYGIQQRFTDLDDFIQNSNVDVAIVCTPTSVRKKVVMPLIEAEIPLFVEKPFADTLEDAVEITEKAKQHGVPICVNQNFRSHFTFNLVKQLIADNTIGNVTAIQFNEIRFRQDAGWRLEQNRHALSVMGIHWIDGIRHILGSNAESVVSLMSSSKAINCVGETDATVQIKFENGTMATYTESFSSPFRRTDMIVIGETGSLLCDHTSVKLFREEGVVEQVWDNNVSRETATFEGLNNLFKSLESGIEAPNSAADNLKTIAMLDGAYKSAENQEIVKLQKALGV